MTTVGSHQAFPDENTAGLTKREYFAALALQGLAAGCGPGGPNGTDDTEIPWQALSLADGLIAALNHPPLYRKL